MNLLRLLCVVATACIFVFRERDPSPNLPDRLSGGV